MRNYLGPLAVKRNDEELTAKRPFYLLACFRVGMEADLTLEDQARMRVQRQTQIEPPPR